MNPPEWLARHDGSLQLSPDGRSRLAFFDGAPRYRLEPRPAAGKFTCVVVQTENGKRIDKGVAQPDADAALRAGLEELRVFLGW
jgi:hypothetical protein